MSVQEVDAAMKRRLWICGGVKVNAGRAPTPIGGDGINPYADVPHWFLDEVSRALSQHGIAFEVRLAYIQRATPSDPRTLSSDPDDHIDRLVFSRSADVRSVQRAIDSISPSEWIQKWIG